MKKRIITLSLALIFTLALFVPAYAAESETLASQGFDDIAPGSWCDEAARWAVEKGITNGTGGNNFSPTRTCSRAEIITFLWRAAGAPVGFDVGYSDVPDDAFFTPAAAWCAENELVEGDDFNADSECTRADVVTYLWTLAGQPAASLVAVCDFEDVSEDTALEEAVIWAVDHEITTGVGENAFAPENTCTRGEIVTFIQRAFEQNIAGLSRPLYTTEPIPLDEYVENMPKGIGLTLGTSQVGLQEPGKYLSGEERFSTMQYVEQDCYVDFGNGLVAHAVTEYDDSNRYFAGYSRITSFYFDVQKGQTVSLDVSAFVDEGMYVNYTPEHQCFTARENGNNTFTIKFIKSGRPSSISNYWGILYVENEDIESTISCDSYDFCFKIDA